MNARFLTRRNGLALAVGLGLGLAGGSALAQSNATGVIFGRTTPGATIHVQNKDTGQNRDLTVGSDGRYRATALQVGNYKVSVEQDGKIVDTRDDVSVAIGGTEVSFAAAASATTAQNLEGVQVVANALPAIDVSSTDSRTVLSAQQLQKIPVQRNVTAAALLAPGTVLADTRYGNVASFGGASASENQYYINGFSVTNSLTGVGLITLPFDAIDQQQILTSAYTAEYGRATGGVVNIVSKRGTNEWKGDVQVLWTPESLQQSPRSIYRTNGNLMQDRSNNKKWETQYSASIGGPLIKDKLFIYLAGDFVKDEGQTTGFASAPTGQASGLATNVNQQFKLEQKATRWLGKIDWNITDNHIVEFTGIGDNEKEHDQFYSYNYATGQRGVPIGTQDTKNYSGVATNSTPGGNVYLGKYTGYITDDLTVTALYGKTMSDHQQDLAYPNNISCPNITDNIGLKPPHCNLVTSQLVPGAQDKTRGWRLDIEYKIGSHDLRGGVDNYNIADYSGTTANTITYNPYDGGQINGHPEASFPAGTTRYAALSTTIFAADVRVSQQAQYLEDNWQVSDRWLAYLGLRNEQFTNYNGSGDPYARQRHQLAPRLGVSWDVFGDSSLKVYANAGRYHISIPASTAIRGASGSIFTSTVGTFTGVDPVTGAPTGYVQSGTLNYVNGENGVTPDPKTVAAKNLKAYYQDEYVLGFDKQLGNDWIVGSKAIYRKLRSSIDDWCDNRPFEAYAAAHGIALTNPGYTTPGSALCFIFNPGASNQFYVDTTGNGNYQLFNLSKKDIGVPNLKRGYYALDTYIEHQFDSHWYGKLEYVFSRSYGNSEGQLDSDIGQQDVSTTESWDFKEIMEGTNGPLPNDRTHQLKAYGFYQLNDEWLFGANLAIASGAPKSCMGYDPADANADRFAYGAVYFFCNGEVTPRGSVGRMPWTYTLNVNTEWKPSFANHKLAFTADIFNLLGKQQEVTAYEIGELAVLNSATGNSGLPNSAYQRPLSFQAPRTFRFGVRYDFSL